MRPHPPSRKPRFACFTGFFTRNPLRRGLRRRAICFALIVNLLIWPVPEFAFGLATVAADVAADTVVRLADDAARLGARFFPSLFAPRPPQRERQADRQARVARLQVAPLTFVGYQNDVLTLNAFASDVLGQTVQGAKFAWESSDVTKLQVSDSGQATLLQPGRAQAVCRVGVIEGRAFVLIRPGSRPIQTDAQWDADQRTLNPDGTTTGAAAGASFNFARAVWDRLAPTAHAQGCAWGNDDSDFGYDELWSEARNLTGNPPHRAIEPMRLGTVMPEGSNFHLAIPLYGLSGRGLGAGFTLSYNSRGVWARHASAVTFNPTQGWPFAGFSLGFGRVFTYGSGASTKYVWVAPDGTRHYLGTGSDTTTGTYETGDGSHITFVGSKASGGSLYFNDGTKVTVGVVNNRLLPTRIRDANGNYVQIAYKAYNPTPPNQFLWRQALWYITDTLGRTLEFEYDACGNLTLIKVPGFNGATRDLARFDYQGVTISNNFSGLTVENRPTGNVPALRHVYFPDTQTGYKFDYSAYGMVYNASLRKQMTYDAGTGAISDGTQQAAVSFNYPTGASSLTDAPAFTQRTETAISSPSATYTYAASAGSGTKVFTVTRPDNSQVILTRSDSGGVGFGLLTQSEVKNSSGASLAKSVYTYATEGGGSVQVQSVISYDDAGVPVKVDFDYDNYGNVTNRRDYGHQISGQWQVRRRTQYEYKTDAAYLNAYLRGLVTEQQVYDGLKNTDDGDDQLVARAVFIYDDYAIMGGMEGYSGQPMPPGHESSFTTAYTVRGNVTVARAYKDVGGGLYIERRRKVDIFGNVTKEDLACCNQRTYTRDDGNGYSAPFQATSGTLTTEMDDDFNTSLVKWAKDGRGLQTTYTYDAALRPDVTTAPTGANADAAYNDAAQTASQTVNFSEGGTARAATSTVKYDGWGRIIEAVNPHGGQVNTTYTALGQVASRSNPFPSGGCHRLCNVTAPRR